MTITLKQFQELSTRTAPHNAHPQNHIEKQYLLTNYVLGLNGEFIEWLLSDNYEDKIKESGDVLHYAVILLKIFNKEAIDGSLGLKVISEKVAYESLGETLEIIKKTYYHGHEFKEYEFTKAVKNIINHLYDKLGKVRFYKALELNIDKLKKRYPEGFSSQASIERVDTK